MSQDSFDVIIIGSGAGGGTMARALADSPARILVIERGDFVPREAENWDPAAVWKDLRYRARDRWLDERGDEFLPYTHYGVGGNTKFWGSVLYRLRREDFQAVDHLDGLSPAWPIDYDTLATHLAAGRKPCERGENKTATVRSDAGCRGRPTTGTPSGVAWRGPIVMNTQAELDTAFAEYAHGTFVKVNAT